MVYQVLVKHSLSNHAKSIGDTFDHKRSEQQRRNWKNHHSNQCRGRTRRREQESSPHRPRPPRKRDYRSRLREGNSSQYGLQPPRADKESQRNDPLDKIPEPVPSTKQPGLSQRRSRTLQHPRTRIHPTRSTHTNQGTVQHHRNRLPTKHRTTHTQRASDLRPSLDPGPVRILPHGRPTNTHQSHGPRKVKTPSLIRLPSRTDNVRRQNSTLTKSPIPSLEQLRRPSSKDSDPAIRQNGGSTEQGTTGNNLSSQEPCVRAIQGTD